jgi:hypothetical protein
LASRRCRPAGRGRRGSDAAAAAVVPWPAGGRDVGATLCPG